MEFQTIEVDQKGPVGWLTLDRPEALNALSIEMLSEIDAALTNFERAEDIRVLVITGNGRAFCAGADINAMADDLEHNIVPFLEKVHLLLGRIRNLSIPVIAALNGITIAGGLELAIAADIIMAVDDAQIGDAHANFGVIPGAGCGTILPQIIGPNLTKYLLFSGETVSANVLLEAGMIAKLFPANELQKGVQDFARKLSEKSPLGLGIMKRMISESRGLSVEECLRLELKENEKYVKSQDFKEGISAFGERRKPVFYGR